MIVFLLSLVFAGLCCEELLELNFFIEPEFDPIEANFVNFLLRNIKNDSIPQFNIFAGDIIKNSVPDSIVSQFLNFVQPDLAAPIDFLFNDYNIDFSLLMSNVKCDSVAILDRFIIEADSMKIGIFSIYTPDWTVKNNLPEFVEFDFEVFNLSKQIASELAAEADFVIMLSNLSKYIDADLIRSLPIDAAVSFDYQKTQNQKMNNGKTSYFSILTNQGKYGKLRLKYFNDRISYEWQEKDFGVKK